MLILRQAHEPTEDSDEPSLYSDFNNGNISLCFLCIHSSTATIIFLEQYRNIMALSLLEFPVFRELEKVSIE